MTPKINTFSTSSKPRKLKSLDIKYNNKKDSYEFNKSSVNFFINIGLQITRRCNLQCIHCCETNQMPDISMQKIEIIIDKLSDAGLKKICITGGEPFLRKDLVEILKYIFNKNIKITLLTNGYLLSKKKLSEIKPFIENIRFSLHGKEDTTNKIMCNKEAYSKIIKGISIANNLNIPISVVSSIFYKNFYEMYDIAKICENNHVEKLYFFSLISRGRGNDIKNNISFDKIAKSIKKIQKDIEKEKWNLDINGIDWSIEGQCVLIFPDGNIVAVPSFKDVKNEKILGNIFCDDLKDIWNTFPFKKEYLSYYKNH